MFLYTMLCKCIEHSTTRIDYNKDLYMYIYFFFQIEGEKSVVKAFKDLLKKEGPRSLTKGMFASIISWIPSSVVMIAAYETLKKLSLKEDAIPLFS